MAQPKKIFINTSQLLKYFPMHKNIKYKYGKLPVKKYEEIPQNKLCVYKSGLYTIYGKVKRSDLILKSAPTINPVTR